MALYRDCAVEEFRNYVVASETKVSLFKTSVGSIRKGAVENKDLLETNSAKKTDAENKAVFSILCPPDRNSFIEKQIVISN